MVSVRVESKKATKKEVDSKPHGTGLCCRTCENHVEVGEWYFRFKEASFEEDLWHKHDDVLCSSKCLECFLEGIK